jgi:pyruvate,water dikinase
VQEAHNFELERIEADQNLTEFSGQVACPGNAQGRVRKILTRAQVSSFQVGEVLVTPMTMPEYLPAMRQAAAFVTDEGGVTCHAAIISREMRKPCIIGTKVATKILKDGDMVEVDADKGIVRKI